MEGGPGRQPVVLFLSFLLPVGSPHQKTRCRQERRGECRYQFSAGIERKNRLYRLPWTNGNLAVLVLSFKGQASHAQGNEIVTIKSCKRFYEIRRCRSKEVKERELELQNERIQTFSIRRRYGHRSLDGCLVQFRQGPGCGCGQLSAMPQVPRPQQDR